MVAADGEAAANRRRIKTHHFVLVSIPEWPPQDPGRLMVYSDRPSFAKAKRMAKRLNKQLPEYVWSAKSMTHAESLLVKRAPFTISQHFESPVRARWSGRRWHIEPADAPVVS